MVDECPIQAAATWAAYSLKSSLSRLRRKFWNKSGHCSSPARKIIRAKCVRKFWAVSRQRSITNWDPPSSACSNCLSSSTRISGKIGITRDSFPRWCSVFGDVTFNRPFSQFTSTHLRASVSDGFRKPPNRQRAKSVRQVWSGQASRSLSYHSRGIYCRFASLTNDRRWIPSKGFFRIYPLPTAHRKTDRRGIFLTELFPFRGKF